MFIICNSHYVNYAESDKLNVCRSKFIINIDNYKLII